MKSLFQNADAPFLTRDQAKTLTDRVLVDRLTLEQIDHDGATFGLREEHARLRPAGSGNPRRVRAGLAVLRLVGRWCDGR